MGILSDIVNEDKVEMCPDACCGKPITECKCGPDCEHCDCYSKNESINEGTQGCADCEWISDETDGDITTCDDCAAEKREKTNESEKRWKQTSMSPEEAIEKYGKENVKVKKGALRNGDDMVEVFVESMNEEMNDDAVKKAIMSSGKEPQDALYDLMSVDGPLGDYVRRSYEITAGENGLHGDDDFEEVYDQMVSDLGLEEEYYESEVSRLKELSGIAEAPGTASASLGPNDPQNMSPKDITDPNDALIYKGSTRGVDDPFDASGTRHADGIGWSQDELDAAMQGFKDVLGTENQIQINRYLAKLPLTIAKGIADQNGYGTYTSPDTGKRYNPDSLIGGYDHANNPNYSIDAMDPETIAKIKDPDWRNTYDMNDPKFKNIRPTEATNEEIEAEIKRLQDLIKY